MSIRTEAQLAELLQVTPERAAELRRRHRWPHLRLGRFDIRYTDAQVEQIVELMTSKAAAERPAERVASLDGQTKRSARRSA